MASLIKAAHLTLFGLFGYSYALSASGRFIGHDILGDFFSKNHTNPKKKVLENAQIFFKEFFNMVPPIEL
ncbi:MAG TPA: hypothetical protein VHL11_03425, partial [Phototrophicaceae bacterium]|nr:hypothetical protein [Phototrophicaceae bacterium]